MRAIILIAVLFGMHGPAWSGGIQAQCGAENGLAYAAEQGIVPKGDGGWYEDASTSAETVIRVDTDSLEVDIRFKDSSKVWASVTDSGGRATVWTIQDSPASMMILLAYPGGAVEVLTLAEMTKTDAKLIHSVMRNLDTLTNSRIMIASCSLSAF